ncbi:MAG: DUF3500 domain-containing protein, partial [Bryobacteraceae bacterium]
MQHIAKLRLTAAGAAMILLSSAYTRTHSVPIMVTQANSFLSSLTPDQLAKAKFAFTDDERLNWHFIPKERKGLPL